MNLTTIGSLIQSVGFPIVCVIGLAWFCYYLVKKMDTTHLESLKMLQDRCVAREDKLSEELAQSHKINGEFAKVLNKHSVLLQDIRKDIDDIKVDVTTIKAKID